MLLHAPVPPDSPSRHPQSDRPTRGIPPTVISLKVLFVQNSGVSRVLCGSPGVDWRLLLSPGLLCQGLHPEPPRGRREDRAAAGADAGAGRWQGARLRLPRALACVPRARVPRARSRPPPCTPMPPAALSPRGRTHTSKNEGPPNKHVTNLPGAVRGSRGRLGADVPLRNVGSRTLSPARNEDAMHR